MIDRATEHKLVARAKQGDGEAIAGLIKAHQDALYAFMLRMSGGKPEMAEDIVQEAFVRVLRNLDRFDPQYRFSTWLFTIAKRLFVNAIQKHRPAFDTDMVGAWAGTDEGPSGVNARRETLDNLRGVLDEALDGLTHRQREVILLFHQQNWSIQIIAEHLDIPEGTVKSHLHRARKRMKKCILATDTLYRQAQEVWS